MIKKVVIYSNYQNHVKCFNFLLLVVLKLFNPILDFYLIQIKLLIFPQIYYSIKYKLGGVSLFNEKKIFTNGINLFNSTHIRCISN